MAITYEKFIGLYQVGSLTDQIDYSLDTPVSRTVTMSDMGFAVGDWISLPALIAAFNGASNPTTDNVSLAFFTNDKLRATVTGGAEFTSFVIDTNGSAGGAFALWMGSREDTGVFNDDVNVSDAPYISSKMWRPADPVISDDTVSTSHRTVGTTADSGRVVSTHFGYSVNKREIMLTVPHDETFELDTSSSPADGTRDGTNNLESQYRLWAQGELFAIHKDRDNDTIYDTSDPDTTGYRVYWLNPTGNFEFRPIRLIQGMDLYWTKTLMLVEANDADWTDETEV